MAERVNVKASVEVKDVADNSDFVKASVEYSNVPLEVFTMMEQSMMQLMSAWGQQGLDIKKNKVK